jgi:hypothetical protein
VKELGRSIKIRITSPLKINFFFKLKFRSFETAFKKTFPSNKAFSKNICSYLLFFQTIELTQPNLFC